MNIVDVEASPLSVLEKLMLAVSSEGKAPDCGDELY